jgi:hypothetical protein
MGEAAWAIASGFGPARSGGGGTRTRFCPAYGHRSTVGAHRPAKPLAGSSATVCRYGVLFRMPGLGAEDPGPLAWQLDLDAKQLRGGRLPVVLVVPGFRKELPKRTEATAGLDTVVPYHGLLFLFLFLYLLIIFSEALLSFIPP